MKLEAIASGNCLTSAGNVLVDNEITIDIVGIIRVLQHESVKLHSQPGQCYDSLHCK